MKIQANSRQIPSIEKYTADKQYNDLLYAKLQEISIMEKLPDGTTIRYVKKKDVKFVELASIMNVSRQKASKNFKDLITLGLIEEYVEGKDIRYKLNYLDQSIAYLIPFDTLVKINDTLSRYSISIYVYLLKRYIANNEEPYLVTVGQMKRFIGVSDATSSNNRVVMNVLYVLQKLGLIEWKYVNEKPDKTNIAITKVRNHF